MCLSLSAGSITHKIYYKGGVIGWLCEMYVCFWERKKKRGKALQCVCACCMCLCIPKATSHRPWLWNINIISNSSLAAKSPVHYTMYVCVRLGQVLHQWANGALPTSHSPLSHSPLSFLLSLCLSLHWSHFSSLASSLSSILSFPSFKNQNMFSVFLKRCCSVSLRPPFSLHQPVLCAHVLSYQLISPVPLFFHPASSLCNPLSLSSLSLFFSCHHSSIIKAKVTNPATLWLHSPMLGIQITQTHTPTDTHSGP